MGSVLKNLEGLEDSGGIKEFKRDRAGPLTAFVRCG